MSNVKPDRYRTIVGIQFDDAIIKTELIAPIPLFSRIKVFLYLMLMCVFACACVCMGSLFGYCSSCSRGAYNPNLSLNLDASPNHKLPAHRGVKPTKTAKTAAEPARTTVSKERCGVCIICMCRYMCVRSCVFVYECMSV